MRKLSQAQCDECGRLYHLMRKKRTKSNSDCIPNKFLTREELEEKCAELKEANRISERTKTRLARRVNVIYICLFI